MDPKQEAVWRSLPAFEILQQMRDGDTFTSNQLQKKLEKKQSTIATLLSSLEDFDLVSKQTLKRKRYFTYTINKLGLLKNFFDFVNKDGKIRMKEEYLNYAWMREDFERYLFYAMQDEHLDDLWIVFYVFAHSYPQEMWKDGLKIKDKIREKEMENITEALKPFIPNPFQQ